MNHPLYLTYKTDLEKGLPERPHINLKTEINLLLLPGSRNFEVTNMLPEFIKTVRDLKKNNNITVHLVKTPNVNEGDCYIIDHVIGINTIKLRFSMN